MNFANFNLKRRVRPPENANPNENVWNARLMILGAGAIVVFAVLFSIILQMTN